MSLPIRKQVYFEFPRARKRVVERVLTPLDAMMIGEKKIKFADENKDLPMVGDFSFCVWYAIEFEREGTPLLSLASTLLTRSL